MMYSTLIVARMNPNYVSSVREIFEGFDATEMPQRMGTRRRELFRFHDLYFHLQDFDGSDGIANVEAAKTDLRFVQVSRDLRPFIEPYDPEWRSPKDAMAERFYHWQSAQ